MAGIQVDLSVKVEGLSKELRQLGDNELRKEMRQAGKESAEIIADEARSLAPVGRGPKRGRRLKDTVKPFARSSTVGVKAGSKKVFYARFVHYGHKKRGPRRGQGRGWVPAQPFIAEAIENTHDEFFRTYDERLDRIIKKFNRRQKL